MIDKDRQLSLRLILLFIIFLSIFAISLSYWISGNFPNQLLQAEYPSQAATIGTNGLVSESDLPFPVKDDIIKAEASKVEQEKIKAEQEKIKAERQVKIDRLHKYLVKVKSPFADQANIIIEQSEKCSANYRIIVAISGNESGYGRIPYKLYNPFGYLNKAQYSGWDTALENLVCKVAKYTNKYGTNFYELGAAYGAVNKEKWAENITWHYSQIP